MAGHPDAIAEVRLQFDSPIRVLCLFADSCFGAIGKVMMTCQILAKLVADRAAKRSRE
jgi:hypothetical protein